MVVPIISASSNKTGTKAHCKHVSPNLRVNCKGSYLRFHYTCNIATRRYTRSWDAINDRLRKFYNSKYCCWMVNLMVRKNCASQAIALWLPAVQ